MDRHNFSTPARLHWYSIVNYLMRRYHVEVPLRTQGWIKERLVNATIENGKCERLQYYRRTKTGRGSQKFFQCMNELIRAVTAQITEKQEAEAGSLFPHWSPI